MASLATVYLGRANSFIESGHPLKSQPSTALYYIQLDNYTNPGYGLSLVDTLWNADSYRQPLEQEGNPMIWIEKFWLQIPLIVSKKS